MADKQTLLDLIKPAVEAAGFQLWGLEFTAGRRGLLRIYIDAENGVGVDDCALVSHQVSGVLEVADPITDAYRLEVSSPGWDRPLFTPEHFQRFVGSRVKLRSLIPQNGRRNFIGVISSANAESIALTPDDGVAVIIPFQQIDKAHIEPDIDSELRNKK